METTALRPAYLTVSGFASGLTGTIGYQIVNLDTLAVTVARTTSGIAEVISGSGVYRAKVTTAPVAGDYIVIWDSGSISPSTCAADDVQIKRWLPR